MFNGRIFIDGNIVLNFLVEEGIGTEDAECNLTGDIEILIIFEKLIEVCLKMIPSREERCSYRFCKCLSINVQQLAPKKRRHTLQVLALHSHVLYKSTGKVSKLVLYNEKRISVN